MNIDEVQEKIVSTYSVSGDWMEIYQKITALADDLPAMRDEDKTEENSIAGCQSQIWLKAEVVDGKILFSADSDARIIRGFLMIILMVSNNRSPDEIASIDWSFMEKAGLTAHLSPVRSNGLHSVIQRIKFTAYRFRNITY